MSRKLAIILTVVAVILCGCPGIASLALAALATSQNVVDAAQQSGVDINIYGGVDGATLAVRLVFIAVALVLIAIPVIIGLVTFFISRKKASTTVVQ